MDYYKFILNLDIKNKKDEVKYSSISICNIEFDKYKLQEIIPKIIFDEENLKFVFNQKELLPESKINIIKRFIPNRINNIEKDVNELVEESIKKNKNFYSFLAEGILSIVFKDIFNYDLIHQVIDVTHTVNDTHTGADACLVDRTNNVFILGEAKFYEKFYGGFKSIVKDLYDRNITNKLDSLKKHIENNKEVNDILLKNLNKSNYEQISIEDFMKQKIIFAGFVLHGEKSDIKKFLKKDFYSTCKLSVSELKDNINQKTSICIDEFDYKIILLHLPIDSKKKLISLMITNANMELEKFKE